MLTSTKNGAPEKDRTASVGAADVIGRVVQHDQWARSEPTTKAGMASCIGSDMSIVGNIECNGPAQVFGRIEGEVRASDLQISEGAQVEGSVIAQNVTVCGRVKGTIRAVRVKLQSGGAVEGDIFHRSLSIDENSQFEGSSRRVENPTDPSSSVDAKGPQKERDPAPLPSIDLLMKKILMSVFATGAIICPHLGRHHSISKYISISVPIPATARRLRAMATGRLLPATAMGRPSRLRSRLRPAGQRYRSYEGWRTRVPIGPAGRTFNGCQPGWTVQDGLCQALSRLLVGLLIRPS